MCAAETSIYPAVSCGGHKHEYKDVLWAALFQHACQCIEKPHVGLLGLLVMAQHFDLNGSFRACDLSQFGYQLLRVEVEQNPTVQAEGRFAGTTFICAPSHTNTGLNAFR